MTLTRRALRNFSFAWLGAGALVAALPGAAVAQEKVQPGDDCEIQYLADEQLTAVIEARGFDFEGFETLCARLERENLAIEMLSGSGNGDDRSVAWAALRLLTIDNMISSPFAATNTRMVDDADDTLQDDLTMMAVNVAFENMLADYATHLRVMREEEARMLTLFGRN